MKRSVVVGMCGASGAGYGIDLLEALRDLGVEVDLVLSDWAKEIIPAESGRTVADVEALATRVHANGDLAAPISSSSRLTQGMVIIPATVRTVAEIAGGLSGTLIARAAENALRTRGRLVVCLRETPISLSCLENLRQLALSGAVVFPLCPPFYHRPQGIQDLFAFVTGRVLDLLGIENERFARWRS